MIKTFKIKLSNSYLSQIEKLVKTKQHLKNILIMNFNKKINWDLLNPTLIQAIVMGTNGGKLRDKIEKIKRDYKDLIPLLKGFRFLKGKIIQEIVDELKSNYKANFTKLKNKQINKFEIKTKKLSKIKKGHILIPNQIICKIKDGILKTDLGSREYSTGIYFSYQINESLLDKINDNTIRTLQLVYRKTECYLHINYRCNDEIIQPKLNPNNYASIDYGIRNHIALVSNIGRSYLIKNYAINSINESTNYLTDIIKSDRDIVYNKKKNIKEKLDKYPNSNYYKMQYNKLRNKYKRLSYKITYLYNKRNNIVNNEINKLANRIKDYCIKYEIKTLIIGNFNVKDNSNLGRKTNRKLYCFPHHKLTEKLKYLLSQYGIEVYIQEESYTSQVSCQYSDVWNYYYNKNDIMSTIKPTEVDKKGLRGYKGIHSIYRNKEGQILNSDINGAYNILFKFIHKRLNISNTQLFNPICIKNDFEFLDELKKVS